MWHLQARKLEASLQRIDDTLQRFPRLDKHPSKQDPPSSNQRQKDVRRRGKPPQAGPDESTSGHSAQLQRKPEVPKLSARAQQGDKAGKVAAASPPTLQRLRCRQRQRHWEQLRPGPQTQHGSDALEDETGAQKLHMGGQKGGVQTIGQSRMQQQQAQPLPGWSGHGGALWPQGMQLAGCYGPGQCQQLDSRMVSALPPIGAGQMVGQWQHAAQAGAQAAWLQAAAQGQGWAWPQVNMSPAMAMPPAETALYHF